MRALTLTQPWATLIVIGAKRVETRSWGISYRGDLVIHAGSVYGPLQRAMAWREPFYRYLAPFLRSGDLPTGQIIGVARLVDTVPIRGVPHLELPGVPKPDEDEYAFGDYRPGRWAWLMIEGRPLAAPIPCRGQLGLWRLPDNVHRLVQERMG